MRNAAWTGNAVFPFATSVFGNGHWSADQVERWGKAHSIDFAQTSRVDALNRQWLTNAGYGAVGGRAVKREATNVARFDREGGVPVLWLAVAAAVVLLIVVAIRHPQSAARHVTVPLLVMLVLQLTGWLFFTHLQSRFLVPTLLPAVLLVGLALASLRAQRSPWPGRAGIAAVGIVVLLLFNASIAPLSQPRDNSQLPAAADAIDSMDIKRFYATLFERVGETSPFNFTRAPGDKSPVGAIPRLNEPLLLVPGTGALLYVEGPFDYASPFDRHPLVEMAEQANGDPAVMTTLMYERGYRLVSVNLREVDRLARSYDPPIAQAARQWLQYWNKGQGWEGRKRPVFKLIRNKAGEVEAIRLNYRANPPIM